MNRLSLLRTWNRFSILVIFLLPWVVFLAMKKTGDWPYYLWMGLSLVVLALLWSIFSNRVILPWMCRGRVFAKSAVITFAEVYLAIEWMLWFNQVWAQRFSTNADDVLGLLYFGLLLHIVYFPVSLPLFLFVFPVRAHVLRFLYNRRDYLPEDV